MKIKSEKIYFNKKLFFFLLVFFLSGRCALAADFYVDSGVTDGGTGTLASPWNNVDDVNAFASSTGFASGDHIKFKRGGSFSGNLVIDQNSGSTSADIFYEDYDSGNLPIISGIVIVSGQSYITIQNLEVVGNVVGIRVRDEGGTPASEVKILNNKVHNYTDSGINAEGGGLNRITISGNEVYSGPIGIYMGSVTNDGNTNMDKTNDLPLGCNNIIEDNVVYDNTGSGIGLSSASLKEYASQYICDGSTQARGYNSVQNNEIRDNGCHGIEIDSNYILVEHNIFTNNGISSSYGGCSGIHLFDRWPSESGANSDQYERGGDYNIIRYNISKENKDRQHDRTDGNGIQMDMWCDYNQVYNNIAYGNDGAGIIAYGASHNEIYNNTLYDNGQDVGIRFGANEMVILSADVDHANQSDATNSNGVFELVSKNNSIKNNIGMAINTDSSNNPDYGFIDCRSGDCRYALAVDDYVINDTSSVGDNVFENNLWFNSQNSGQAIAVIKVSQNEHFQLPVGGTSLNDWNGKSGVQDENVANPLFKNAGSANFHVQDESPNVSPAIDSGQSIAVFDDDFEGTQRPQGAQWDAGAFETNASVVDLEKSITSFSFNGLTPNAIGTIDEARHTITVAVPVGTDVTALVPTIAISQGTTISPATGVAQNFTNPVVYAVTAQDASAQNYTVTVSIGDEEADEEDDDDSVSFKKIKMSFKKSEVIDKKTSLAVIKLKLDYPKGVSYYKVSKRNSFNGVRWKKIDDSIKLKLDPDKVGKQSFYLKFKDKNGNTSHVFKKSVEYVPQYPIFTVPNRTRMNEVLHEYGENFSSNSDVELHFSAYGGGYHPTMIVRTDAQGKFSLNYTVNKPVGRYHWFAIDRKTGKKSEISYYDVLK